jgi:hypothetical protein
MMSGKSKAMVRKEQHKKDAPGTQMIGLRKMTASQLLEELGDGSGAVVFQVVIGLDEHVHNADEMMESVCGRQVDGTVYMMRPCGRIEGSINRKAIVLNG